MKFHIINIMYISINPHVDSIHLFWQMDSSYYTIFLYIIFRFYPLFNMQLQPIYSFLITLPIPLIFNLLISSMYPSLNLASISLSNDVNIILHFYLVSSYLFYSNASHLISLLLPLITHLPHYSIYHVSITLMLLLLIL